MFLIRNTMYLHLIILMLVGVFPLVAACADDLMNTQQVEPGTVWGGEGIRLIVTENGATIEYDCAYGSIDEPLRPDVKGYFEAKGIHVIESGGPAGPKGPRLKKHSAIYQGWIEGRQMRLIVTLSESEKQVGTFLLGLDAIPLLEKCL